MLSLGMGLAACGGGGGGGNQAPVAGITSPAASASVVAAGGAIAFEGACVDVEGDALTYEWSFPGGSPAASTEQAPGAVTFAAEGEYTVTYRCTDVKGHASQVVTRTVGVVTPGVTHYQIALRYLTAAGEAYAGVFEAAAARISEVIIADLPDLDETLPAYPECGLEEPVLPPVDDLLVVVDIGHIDGVGNVLGQAGPCYRRSTGKLPLVGIMQFDEDDLAALEASGELGAVILHEMLHVVGFGTLWPTFGRIRGAGGTNPYFDGSRARAAFADYNGGSAYSGTPVPVENTGGEGTADAHWRETVFENELMTGWLSGSTQPLSRTTVESLADMGYGVNALMADPFDLSTAALLAQGAAGEVLFLGNDVVPIAPRDH